MTAGDEDLDLTQTEQARITDVVQAIVAGNRSLLNTIVDVPLVDEKIFWECVDELQGSVVVPEGASPLRGGSYIAKDGAKTVTVKLLDRLTGGYDIAMICHSPSGDLADHIEVWTILRDYGAISYM
ncbi:MULTISPECIES: hypothetical protein [Inquilinus]|uniref:Uncharacterized protein n=1 Tax=Inquilinus ginsengisoli TaxID=363840 RepID=A0ABU1JPI3_9PROT|nr:hypothetical protein [Inquilinus ginsengisoli]MDR6290522.1 hypothetical protein [Inquilinus ginsengisoli]